MTCLRGPHGRALKGQHDPHTCPGEDTCPGCQPCTEDHCPVCRKVHHKGACPGCVGEVRTDITTMVRLAGHLHTESRAGRPAFMVRDGIPGGDALVLLAPGSTRHGQANQLAHRKAWGLDTTHVQDESDVDPRPPLAVLLRWDHHWRKARNQPTDLAPTLGRVAGYLTDHLTDLAGEVLFPLMARDLALTLRRLEDALHDGERPDTSRVPCWECGVRLEKVYAESVRDDHWTCPRCGERYDRGRYDRAKFDHLASVGAERYVTVPDAAAAVGRSVRTVREWIRRGEADVHRDPVTSRVRVWWPDVRALHLATVQRKTRRELATTEDE